MARYDYTGAIESINLSAGRYQFECYGAQGKSGNGSGGLGGYASGEFILTSNSTIYLAAGSQPTGNAGGFNGGGGANDVYAASSAGGASDIRIGGNALSNRVIVAGGGGGAGSDGSSGGTGGSIIASGTLGIGADASWIGSGAGGGGYYGGAAGGWYYSAGGGGSSYVDENAENTEMTAGVNTGNGYIIITTLSVPTQMKAYAQII